SDRRPRGRASHAARDARGLPPTSGTRRARSRRRWWRDRPGSGCGGPSGDAWRWSPLPAGAAATEASTATRESPAAATASTTPAAEAAAAHEAAPRRPHRHVRALRSERVVQATLAALETHRLPREDQRHDAEQDEEADHREVRSPAAARAAIRLALTGPLVNRAGRRLDAGRIAPLAKARRDDVADDAGRRRVGDGGLEAIADFQADSALGEEDDQDDAVVEVLLADAPALGQLDRDVVDALAL